MTITRYTQNTVTSSLHRRYTPSRVAEIPKPLLVPYNALVDQHDLLMDSLCGASSEQFILARIGIHEEAVRQARGYDFLSSARVVGALPPYGPHCETRICLDQ